MPEEALVEATEMEEELAFLKADLERFGPGVRSGECQFSDRAHAQEEAHA